jgi:hypothetical protein
MLVVGCCVACLGASGRLGVRGPGLLLLASSVVRYRTEENRMTGTGHHGGPGAI